MTTLLSASDTSRGLVFRNWAESEEHITNNRAADFIMPLCFLGQNKRPMFSHGPSGGLVEINQEVVTLMWPLRHNSGPGAT